MALNFRKEGEDETEEELEEEPEEETEEESPAETLSRNSHSMETASSSSAWNFSEDESSLAPGMRPSDLYGKFTWKIENFLQISKRELRSNLFEVGGCKWYILVYPQGCDVCNHLSLFMCVADYDKLLPGWSHFAQFTIAVVNKDPKKSKYSDTLHRFCKKEHDWGWKKFMELSKVLDGFSVAETLVIKAQVQVIRENPHRPFRCLDYQYRRELIRVYLTNVEGICRRFVEEKREKIGKLMEDSVGWSSFRGFWSTVEGSVRRRLSREKIDIILKSLVKCFFNQKEVTSPLVVDALYSGYRVLDFQSKNRKGKPSGAEVKQLQNPIVWIDKDFFVLADDVLLLLERALNESIPFYKDEKGPQNRTKDGCSEDDSGKDALERDERRLTELGRRTVEMFVLGHLFSNRIEVAYLEAIALRRQEELIREEEAAEQAEIELKARREIAEREKRIKKKQAKQRRNDRKEKDKSAEVKHLGVRQLKQQDGLTNNRATVSSLSKGTSIMGDNRDDDSNVLLNVGGVVGTLKPAIEDGEVDQIIWEREASEFEATFSGAPSLEFVLSKKTSRKHEGLRDDSSSTCSSDSILSLCDVSNGSGWKKSSTNWGDFSQTSASRRSRGRARGDKNSRQGETGVVRAHEGISEGKESNSINCSSDPELEATVALLRQRSQSLQQSLSEKVELVDTLQKCHNYCQGHVGTNENGLEGDARQSKADSDIPIREKNELLCRKDGALKEIVERITGKDVQKSPIIQSTSQDGLKLANDILESQVRITNTTAKNTEGTLRSFDVASFPSVSSTDTVDIRSSRPSSAPDLPVTSRTAPVVNQQYRPQLSRCVSASESSELTATDLASSSSVHQGSLAIPSYRNSHVSMAQNSNSLTSMLTSWAECDFRTNDLLNMNVTFHGDGGEKISTCSAEQSDFSTKKMLVAGAKGELTADQIICKSGQSKHQENSMGFTFGTVTPELLHSEQGQENQVNQNVDNVYHFEAQFASHESRGNLLLDNHITESPASEHNMSLSLDEHQWVSSQNITSPSSEQHLSQHINSSALYEHQRNLEQQIPNSSLYEHLSSLSKPMVSSSSGEHLSQHITDSSSNEHLRSLPQHAISQSNEQDRNFSQHITSSSSEELHMSFSQRFGTTSSGELHGNLYQGITSSSSNPHSSQHETNSSLDECQRSLSQHITRPGSNEYQVSSSQHHIARHRGTEEASGSGATEEFPHLDIINELLDEDRLLGVKTFLRHDASIYSSISPYDLYHHRMYTGQIGMDINGNGAERGNTRAHYHDGCTTLPRFSDASEADGMQLHYPYAHSPFHYSVNTPCGIIEPIPQHHWQSSQGNLSNGFRNNMDMLIGYPFQTHLPIPNCPYTLGQNGYPIYSPLKHP